MPRVKKTIKQEGKIIKPSKSKRHSVNQASPEHPESEILKQAFGSEVFDREAQTESAQARRVQNDKRDSGVSRQVGIPRMTKRQARMTSNGLTMEFFDTKGKVAEKIELPKEIFAAKINNQLMAQAVRVYLANQRMGTASTKTRGEVHGSTRKIWAQKHTGRARHGSRKAPIFVHGGIVFGPKPRDFSLKLSKKMKRLALFSALTSKFKKGEIKGITGFEKIEPKTKLMVMALKDLGVSDKDKKVLLLISTKKEFENVYRASRNIKGVRILDANLLNAYEVLNNNLILLMRESLKIMEERFLRRV